MIIRPVVLAGRYWRPAGLQLCAATVNTNGLLQADSFRFACGGSRKANPADARTQTVISRTPQPVYTRPARRGWKRRRGLQQRQHRGREARGGFGFNEVGGANLSPPEFVSNICEKEKQKMAPLNPEMTGGGGRKIRKRRNVQIKGSWTRCLCRESRRLSGCSMRHAAAGHHVSSLVDPVWLTACHASLQPLGWQ